MKSSIVYKSNDHKIQKIISYPKDTCFKDSIVESLGKEYQRFYLDVNFDIPIDSLNQPKFIRQFSNNGFGITKIRDNNFEKIIYDGKDAKDLELVIEGWFHLNTGYSLLTREFGRRLIKSDLPVRFYKEEKLAFRQQTCVNKEEIDLFYKKNIKTKEYYSGKDFISFGFHHPFTNFLRQKYNIVYTMIESYSLYPNYWQIMDGCYDRFIVPTNFVKDVFSQYVEEERIDVVPLGVDLDKLHPNIERNQEINFKLVNTENDVFQFVNQKPSGFRFLYQGRFSHRKGSDLILKAFCEGFSAADDVSLVLFTIPEIKSYHESLNKNINGILSKYSHKSLAPIYLIDYTYPEDKKSLPYSWGDCFVFPSRGEGFGLPPLEAAACGLPLICSNNSGLSDFIDDSVATVIPYDIIDHIGNFKQREYNGKYPEWGHDCFYDHMNEACYPIMNSPEVIHDIADKMRYVYENHSSKEITDKVDRMIHRIHDNYTWDNNYQLLEKTLRKIIGT